MSDTIDLFKARITRHEDQLFGISIYFQSVELLYADDPETLQVTRTHYQEIMERGRTALYNAQILLSQVNIGTRHEDDLSAFVFPPIEGHPGLDALTQRAEVLVECYEKLFPHKTRDDAEGLSRDELTLLIQESSEKFFR